MLVVKSGPGIDRFKIRDQIAESDRRFTVNTERICGLTFREKMDDVVSTPIDIIDDKVVSPNYSSSLLLICRIRRLCTFLRA